MLFKQKKNKFQSNKHSLPEISAFILILLGIWAGLQSVRLGAMAFEIKEKVLASARGGASYLESAKRSIAAQDLNVAAENFAQALEEFHKSQGQLETLKKDLPGFSRIIKKERDAQNLFSASADIAQAGENAIRLIKLSSNLSFGAQGLMRGGASLNDLSLEADSFIENLTKAEKKISHVNLKNLPERERKQLLENLHLLSFAKNSAQTLKRLLFIGQSIFTGQKRILLLFQNSNELRPTGGFLGSFGELQLKDGLIERLHIASIYDLDGQLNESIMPPEPLLAVNTRWFLRDANWFTSFPDSVKKIIAFYEKEGGETPDLTIALTPKTIADLLKITGPLKTPEGATLDEEVFIEQLQILAQTGANDPTNEPKKILSQLFTELLQKISGLDSLAKAKLLQALQQSLLNKHILLYAKQRQAQEILSGFNWAGEFAESDRDFLLISAANLGGTKTDLSVEQKIKLESEIKPDGQIENTLTVTRQNKMPALNNAHNKAFLRFYVPKGARLIKAEGFDRVDLERPKNASEDPKYKIDADVFAWEKSQVKDVVSGTFVGEESGKTFFGNWVEIPGGQSRALSIKYLLPIKLKNIDRHSLILQKQPGTLDFEFEYSVKFPERSLEWTSFALSDSPANEARARAMLNKDLFFGMVLRRNN